MTDLARAGLVVAVGFAVIAAFALKGGNPTVPAPSEPPSAVVSTASVPRMIELGADKCIPCKAMQPILAELRTNYGGKLKVDFFDVWKDPAAGERFQIRSIPTQVFLDASGKEVYRHEGFFAKADIVAKMKELGFGL